MGGDDGVGRMDSEVDWEGVDGVVGFMVVEEVGSLDMERVRTSAEELEPGHRTPRCRVENVGLEENGRGVGRP